MLYGRVREMGVLEELLTRSAAGHAGSVVLRGEAGIGKTELLDHTAGRARELGFRVLRVTGTEAESALAFAGLHLLLGRVRDRFDRLPDGQARALRAAFGSGEVAEANRFLVGVAVLTLLAELADESPLLVLVDDAQWLDRASLDALLFLARRLDAEPIALVISVRDNHIPELHELPARQVDLARLDADAAAALLADTQSGLTPAAAQWILGEAQGNPLALRILPTLRRSDHMYASPYGRSESRTQHRIQQAFADRIATLPETTRQLLLIAAVDDSGDPALILAAATDAGHVDLDTAEAAEVLRVHEGRITFTHPLIRAAVQDAATPAQCREAHRRLADALTGEPLGDRRARHLAAASTEPDDAVADLLDQVAARARACGATSEACATYRRAADLSTDPIAKGRRLIEAAAAAVDLGDLDRAARLADLALPLTTDPAVLATVTALQADIAREQDRPDTAYQSLLAAAAFVTAHDPATAGRLLFRAADAAWAAGNLPAVEQTAARAEALGLPDAERVRAVAELVHGGNPGPDTSAEKATVALRLLLAGTDSAQLRERGATAYWHLLLADPVAARELSAALAADCRRRGAIGVLTRALMVQARAEQLLGRCTAATATATEGLRLAADTGQRSAAVYQYATLALLAASRGDERACLEYVSEPLARGIAPGAVHATAALGLLELGSGRPDAAVDRLLAVLAGANRNGIIAAIPDLVEAAYRAGRLEEAREAFDWYRVWADHIGQEWVRALAHRCAALFATDPDTVAGHFTDALRMHNAHHDFGFDRARTELLYGEWLRRDKRRVEARARLRAAADTFRRLGATVWAERAEGELRASGETLSAAPAAAAILDRLTPQELQTARLAATGLSNKDIGAQLFLSPRTVGFHLSNTYPKLGIASRRELAGVFRETI